MKTVLWYIFKIVAVCRFLLYGLLVEDCNFWILWIEKVLVTFSSSLYFAMLYLYLFCLQVFVKIKAINGAGLSSTSTSNGVFISYLSQGLEPLLPVGIWDADPLIIGDM